MIVRIGKKQVNFGPYIGRLSPDLKIRFLKQTKIPRPLRPGDFYVGLPNYTSLAPLTLTPGPMVAATVQLLIYWPLAAAGLALMMAPMRAAKFSLSFSGPNDRYRMGKSNR